MRKLGANNRVFSKSRFRSTTLRVPVSILDELKEKNIKYSDCFLIGAQIKLNECRTDEEIDTLIGYLDQELKAIIEMKIKLRNDNVWRDYSKIPQLKGSPTGGSL